MPERTAERPRTAASHQSGDSRESGDTRRPTGTRQMAPRQRTTARRTTERRRGGEDVVDVLTADHDRVEGWFRDYEVTSSAAERKRFCTNIIIELVRHAEAEEMYVYPRARLVLENGREIIDRAISEHSEAERIMRRLDRMRPMDSGFDPLMRDLMRIIREHVREEEQGWFPELRTRMPAAEQRRLGELVEGAKVVAPTRPHPAAPNRPPFNVLFGVGVGVVDRARDLLVGRRQR